jgi:hypothetical protein
MHDALTMYFDGEKYAGLTLAGVAVCAIAVATLLYRAGGEFRSFAITLGILALAEVALGVGLYARTGPQVGRLEEQLRSDATSFYASEARRMARVQRNFVLVEYAELVVIVMSAFAAVILKAKPGPEGVALGLLISASVLLAFDLLAERRGAHYLQSLTFHQRST